MSPAAPPLLSPPCAADQRCRPYDLSLQRSITRGEECIKQSAAAETPGACKQAGYGKTQWPGRASDPLPLRSAVVERRPSQDNPIRSPIALALALAPSLELSGRVWIGRVEARELPARIDLAQDPFL